jgi:alanyl-tRNA synthetase
MSGTMIFLDVFSFIPINTCIYITINCKVSGGQVADKGTVGNENFEIEVTEVTKAPNGQNLHN